MSPRQTDITVESNGMIYRILVSNQKYVFDESSGQFVSGPDGSLVGVGTAGLITDPSLKAPRFENRRVRFFFTEKGWRDIGQSIVTEAIREGHLVRVIRRKNPTKAQVFYKDADQVAILPSHLKRRRKQSLHRERFAQGSSKAGDL